MSKRMKKYTLLFMVLLLTGCQETPEETYVTNKSEGLQEEYVIEQSDKRKELNVPVSWSEQIIENDGGLTLTADSIGLDIPDIKNTPVIEVERTEFSEEKLKELVDYFAGEDDLYKISYVDESKLKGLIEDIQKKNGMFGIPETSMQSNYQQRLNNLEKLQALLGDTPSSKEYITEIGFDDYCADLFTYGLNGDIEEKIKATYGKKFLMAALDKDAESTAYIKATAYDEATGLNSGFQYEEGNYLTEKWIQKEKEKVEKYQKENYEWGKQYESFLVSFDSEPENKEFTKEEALNLAEMILKDLEINGMAVSSIEKVYWSPMDFQWNPMDFVNGKAGYEISFGLDMEGLTTFLQTSANAYRGMNENSYKPLFMAEEIKMVITEDGVKKFTWVNMCKKNGIIAENTLLMDFEDIVESLTTHLLAIKIAVDHVNNFEGNETSTEYVVKDVKLRSAYVNAFEAPTNAWIVPAWFFTLEQYTINHLNDDFITKGNDEVVVINAIDGGYIIPPQQIDFFK